MNSVLFRSANRWFCVAALLSSGVLSSFGCGGDGTSSTGTGGGAGTSAAGGRGGTGTGTGGSTGGGTAGSVGGSIGGGGAGGSAGGATGGSTAGGGGGGSSGGSTAGAGGRGGAAGGGGTGGAGGSTAGAGGRGGTGGGGGTAGGAGGATAGAGGRGGAAGGGGTAGGAGGSAGGAGTGGGAAGTGGGAAGTGGGTAGTGGGAAGAPANLHLYVGCSDSSGTIQSYTLNGSTGAIAPLSTFLAGGAISNSEFNDAEDRLYVCHQISGEGRITTYTRNVTNGALTQLGTPAVVPVTPPSTGGAGGAGGAGGTGGAAVTYANTQTLHFDRTRHFLASPNFASHNVYIYGLNTDGSVASLVSSHSAGNNAHDAVFTLNNDFMMVPYLGGNLIEVYSFNETTGAIAPSSTVTLPAMTGPRHVALHPNGMFLYSINETAGTIDVWTVNQTSGAVASASLSVTVPLPSGYTGTLKMGSEIDIAPSGDLLFVSMRLDNAAEGSLVSYMINANTGALTLIEQEASHGITPRQFSLSKDRRLLVVGNQNSNTIAVFRVDAGGNMTFVADRDVCLSPRFARMAIDQ